MLISAGQVPKQCLRLVQVFLPPTGAVNSTHFPKSVWQFNHLQKRHFLRTNAHVLSRIASKLGSALVTHRQEPQLGIQGSKFSHSTLGPFSLSVLIPSYKGLANHVFLGSPPSRFR